MPEPMPMLEPMITRVARVAMILYTCVVAGLAIAIAIVAVRFEIIRPHDLTWGDSVRVIPNLRPSFVISFAVGGVAAAAIGIAVIILLLRGRVWPLYAVLVGALGLLALLYAGNEILHRIEGVYYGRSPWVRQYLIAAYPLAALSAAAALLVIAERLAALARRGRGRPGGATFG
ncbi:MAG TPA: hypothetical protein VKB80_03520 [Kofleriaceae bacterium]|nr:hypothetical protein [Kofleriaceae bacterium]